MDNRGEIASTIPTSCLARPNLVYLYKSAVKMRQAGAQTCTGLPKPKQSQGRVNLHQLILAGGGWGLAYREGGEEVFWVKGQQGADKQAYGEQEERTGSGPHMASRLLPWEAWRSTGLFGFTPLCKVVHIQVL